MLQDKIEELDNDDLQDDIEDVNDESRLYEHFRIVVDKGQELLRIDKFLLDRLSNISRNRIQKAADAGFIHVNDGSRTPSQEQLSRQAPRCHQCHDESSTLRERNHSGRYSPKHRL